MTMNSWFSRALLSTGIVGLYISTIRKGKQNYHTVGTAPKTNKKIIGTDAKSISQTYIHDLLLSWFSSATSMNIGGFK